MKIEVWSDIRCPFCYIGKRRLEKAIEALGAENIDVEYKSFLLDPSIKTDETIDAKEHLAHSKGISDDEVTKMFGHVTEMASGEGLKFNFDSSIVANSINAHRLLHLAKQEGKQAEMKEILLKAHFEDGKNIDDAPTLKALAEMAGLSKDKSTEVIESDAFTEEVKNDIQQARDIGVQGVPFFVAEGKYAVSGAQSVDVFKGFLEKAQEEA
ncbi:DsbA family oxidoreductase [Brumimicrobium aurantiacum]|uniref:DsbA family oxidoreductase n=1 Tax=Brumimicrobium aurantiacum TaxID=1737063 RepID=A0A3E1EXC1_9FLAO|nr:DsbA family oxidoreductase [Brumimicrobium aurantiacum]RFC54206.1 DsbA family oxidoreductase [Brumimicrobium aurantiacum]